MSFECNFVFGLMILVTNMWRASPLPSNCPAPAGGPTSPAPTLTLATWMLHQIPYVKGSVLQDCALFPFQIQLTNPAYKATARGYRLKVPTLFPQFE